MRNDSNWLNNLKVGDKVIVENMNWKRITTIEKITPTRQIKLVGYNRRFKDGSQIGSYGYNVPWLSEWTQEKENVIMINATKKRELLTHIKNCDFSMLSINTLEKIIKTIDDD